MKLINSIIIMWFMFFTFCQGQQMDMQWYILNGKGLNGPILAANITPDNSNNSLRDEIWSTELGHEFIIGGISAPLSTNPPGGDGIFAIFENGSFYASRYSNIPSFSEMIQTNSAGVKYISISTESPTLIVSELQYSNFYDTDDLPEHVSVEPGGNNSNLIISPFSEEESVDIPVLIAQQSVLPGKDITLTILNYRVEDYEQLILTFNQIIPKSGVDVINREITDETQIKPGGDFFSKSTIFQNNKWVYPESLIASEANNQTVIQKTEAAFIHINLRAKPILHELAPLEVEEEAQTYAVFELYKNEVIEENFLARTIEPILTVRDPNQLVVLDVCIECRSIYYSGQFFNLTTTLASGLAAEIDIPVEIDISTIKIDSNNTLVNEKLAIPTVNFVGRKMILQWSDTLGIRRSVSSYQSDTGKVEFAFCANFENAITISDMYDAELKPSKAISILENQLDTNRLETQLAFSDSTERYNGEGGFNRTGKGHCRHCLQSCQETDIGKGQGPIIQPKCKWFNCWDFWVNSPIWFTGALLGLGLVASFLYFGLQKDKQRRR